MLCSIINKNGKETVKCMETDRLIDLIGMLKDSTNDNCDKGNVSDNSDNSIIIHYGNFDKNTCNSKFLFNYNVHSNEDSKNEIIIEGESFNDYEEHINDRFVIDKNDVFDAYYEDDGYEKRLHINMFECGEYVEIRKE